ncbi:methionyl-tRNA formyltransferase [Aurantimonas sp. C2-6-R+9]|uniref:methionyl-tRNA formyltransferase n=1 Tax=unclassified Aurantimonas TaxID=2638230 RepID=UPI002E16F285|nr:MULTISPECIES: methionyl-tRNA formyltransferase [unclassified Aurantimonas]MEC5292064.1 methionyl-tRNA formyltransferase [Aurantimonas sp. C2-3-R2]MEC5382182.1 methionyl-tRNA formyltransferase [Aurantimonas sp. C2-6-R+9]MEC5413118.1 methionyl-tRNA formyltransferase [Aurantimonas sp. C2-4-R8]
MTLRVVFMGTPAFAVPTLRAIHAAEHDIAAVYTQPPRKAGRRGLTLTPSPIQTEAERLGLDVRTPLNFKDEAEITAFATLESDVAIVVAYGLLLPRPILDAPRHGCLNGHGSLLPRWRGAAPIQRAIEAGDAATGMMVMRMELGLDTGPVALTAETPIGETETAGELHDRLAAISADLMAEALQKLEAGTLTFEDQDAIAARTGRAPLYARKIDKAEAALDFAGDARLIAAKSNAFSPFPGAWTTMSFGGKPERVKILRASPETGAGVPGTVLDDHLLVACGSGAVRLLELQRAGGKPMAADDLLRGSPVPAGSVAGST